MECSSLGGGMDGECNSIGFFEIFKIFVELNAFPSGTGPFDGVIPDLLFRMFDIFFR